MQLDGNQKCSAPARLRLPRCEIKTHSCSLSVPSASEPATVSRGRGAQPGAQVWHPQKWWEGDGWVAGGDAGSCVDADADDGERNSRGEPR